MIENGSQYKFKKIKSHISRIDLFKYVYITYYIYIINNIEENMNIKVGYVNNICI